MTQNHNSPEKTVAHGELARLERKAKWLTWICYAAAISSWALFRLRISLEGALVCVIVALTVGIAGVVYQRRAKNLEKQLTPTRGRCMKCDYDLAGLDRPKRCPECGTPIVYPPASHMQ